MRADFEKGIKICFDCHRELSISEFNKDRSRADGLCPRCRECSRRILKERNSKESVKSKQLEYSREYNKRPEVKEKNKIRRNSEEMKQYMKEWFSSEKGKESLRKSNQKRKENGKQSEWIKTKRQTDPFFAMSQRFRARLGRCFDKNGLKSEEILGCSWEDFKKYIESQFKEGMSWENRNEWDIDHIIPVSYFKKTNGDMRICFHYLNLQPLWKDENRWKKKCSIPENYLERIEGIKSYISS